MQAAPDPIRPSRVRIGNEGAILVWLDALANGLCPPKTFLRAIDEHYEGNRDGNWEVLSLLDQYFRRGKITADVFQTVKAALQDSALGVNDSAGDQPRRSATISVTTPVVAPSVISSAAADIGASATSPTRTPTPTPPTPTRAPAPPPAAAESRPGGPREIAVGELLRGRYQVRRVLGTGGMGTVFEATDEYRLDMAAQGRRIAIKVLHPDIALHEQRLAELQLEFQYLQSLSHPNIVRVHEFDRDGETAFFTMELLNGAQLGRVLLAREGAPLPRPQALAVIRDVGAALAYAHSHGVVHGDVNPQNIFVTQEGEIRVLDFGAASKHAPVATSGYASCQVLEGQPPQSRDDVFAFACVMYLLLTGRQPFARSSALQARSQRLRPARPNGLASRQWRVLREGLKWERDDRPADIGEWLNRFGLQEASARVPALPALLRLPPRRGTRNSLAFAATLVAVAIAAGTYWASTNPASFHQSTDALTTRIRAVFTTADGPSQAPPPAPVEVTPMAQPAAPPPAAPAASAPAASAPAKPPVVAAVVAPAGKPSPAGSVVAPSRPTGPVRIELAADTVDAAASDETAHVVVRRKGSTRGAATFKWWTESGTAKPGSDFTAVTPREGRIEDGGSMVTLDIPISRTPRTEPKSFYVVIDKADDGAEIGSRTLTMVTLQPGE